MPMLKLNHVTEMNEVKTLAKSILLFLFFVLFFQSINHAMVLCDFCVK